MSFDPDLPHCCFNGMGHFGALEISMIQFGSTALDFMSKGQFGLKFENFRSTSDPGNAATDPPSWTFAARLCCAACARYTLSLSFLLVGSSPRPC